MPIQLVRIQLMAGKITHTPGWIRGIRIRPWVFKDYKINLKTLGA